MRPYQPMDPRLAAVHHNALLRPQPLIIKRFFVTKTKPLSWTNQRRPNLLPLHAAPRTKTVPANCVL
jgi:hypothetical protein